MVHPTNVDQVAITIRDGKISSERVLKEKNSDLGSQSISWHEEEETQDEFAIIDRAGRVQIPKQYLEANGLSSNKVKIEFTEGSILIKKE